MTNKIINWIGVKYNKIINSIAFYPGLIAIAFLILSYVVLQLDFSDFGKELKSDSYFTLKDASTARSIAATIAAGILSLTVFSFSMVMILLNQVASNMSNRVLDQLIGNRFHQIVLGFYIGTIVYALFLLSTIRDNEQGIYVPALSTYFLIGLAVLDMFLFIYFLHYITQSVKYETIIQHTYGYTHRSLKDLCTLPAPPPDLMQLSGVPYEYAATKTGYFQSFNQKGLAELCAQENWRIFLKFAAGSFVLKGTPILLIENAHNITEEQKEKIHDLLTFYTGQPFDTNPYNGFQQLTEIALKALSPGINDPGTAIQSLHRLIELFVYRLKNFPDPVIKDDHGTPRILRKEPSFATIFETYLMPIWDYGKEDRLLRQELHDLLIQLQTCTTDEENQKLIHHLLNKIQLITPKLTARV